MSLIDNRNLSTGFRGKRRMSESEWTRLLLRHGEAELADSERRWLAAGKDTGAAATAPSAPVQDGPGEAVARARPPAPGHTPQPRKRRLRLRREKADTLEASSW